MRPILKQVSEIATQLSVAPSGSSERNLAAAMISVVAGERRDWLEDGVLVPMAGVCIIGTGAEFEEGCRGWLSLSLVPALPLFLFVGRLTKRWMMYSCQSGDVSIRVDIEKFQESFGYSPTYHPNRQHWYEFRNLKRSGSRDKKRSEFLRVLSSRLFVFESVWSALSTINDLIRPTTYQRGRSWGR